MYNFNFVLYNTYSQYIVFIFYPLRFTHQKNSQKIHALKTNTYIKEGKVLTHKNNPQITF